MDPLLTATMASDELAAPAESLGYAAAARRGNVLPVCMRLTDARADADWARRMVLVREVGPACPPPVLDRACSLMPDAPEPRLLRAARSVAIASTVTCGSTRRAWLAFARHDLLDAARLDPMNSTARTLLAELIGTNAWAFQPNAA